MPIIKKRLGCFHQVWNWLVRSRHNIIAFGRKLVRNSGACSWAFYIIFTLTFLFVSHFPTFDRSLVVITQPSTATAVEQPSPAQTQIEQGRILYKTGQFSAAVKNWQEAAAIFESQGDRLGQALSLNLISLGYQQLGQWQAASTAITQSLQLLQHLNSASPANHSQLTILAQALNTQGELQLSQGQAQAALDSWKQAEATYIKVNNTLGYIGSLLNQTQAMQALGLYKQEVQTLTQVKEILEKQPDSLLKVDTLIALGDAWRRVGELEKSRAVLQQSLALAQRLQAPEAIAKSLLALGNTAHNTQDNKAALDFYAQAAKIAVSPTTQVQAQLNQLSLLLDLLRIPSAKELYPQIQRTLNQLPASRNTVYALIKFAESLIRLRENTETNRADLPEIAQVLVKATQQARSLADGRGEAYALGTLGSLYEANAQWADAQTLTQQAILQAQAFPAPDIAYRWYWQLGRILKAQGQTQEAIAAYTEAIKILPSLRSDLVSINTEIQFSFRKSVEPVYRQLIGLLLTPTNNAVPTQQNLTQALDLMEALQLAELDNFFGDTCSQTVSDAQVLPIGQADPRAAIIYPIILSDRLEVILSLPGQPLQRYFTPINQGKVESTIIQLQGNLLNAKLTNNFQTDNFLPLAQTLYNWLVQPAEAELRQSQSKTLVFVLDGLLRNIPMSLLHDGQQYLLEKYAIALGTSQKLLNRHPLANQPLKAFTGGLTEPRQGFAALPAVAEELKQIQSIIPSEILLNQKFTTQAVEQKLKSTAFPIIHLATHGKFGSKAKQTFILTWDSTLNINQLEQILKARQRSGFPPIELLVFSACQTAQGDERAALGLAGMAVRSGASSTLASLWSVSDEATSILMHQFYRELANHQTKGEALRQAQLALLKNSDFQHPYFWAAYVLVGNWF